MAGFQIEETFRVAAPPEAVWRFLLDPTRVAPCLPGAELDERIDDRNFVGSIRVKVGPVAMAYKARVALAEVDDAERRVTLQAHGSDRTGGGTVTVTMRSQVAAVDGGAEVRVASDVQLTGKIVRFGRGMIQAVSAQLFAEFAGNARRQLEGANAYGAAAASSPPPVGDDPTSGAAAGSDRAAAPAATPTRQGTAPQGTAPQGTAPQGTRSELRAIPLMFRAALRALGSWWNRVRGSTGG